MSQGESTGDITVFLRRLREGDPQAENQLADAVYERMRVLARATIGRQRDDISLPATALANEVLLELMRASTIDWKDREHFYRTAARLLRRRLIDYIRTCRASKRPPKASQLPLDPAMVPAAQTFDKILYVHEGLDRLATFDPSLAELVELIYFGGVTIKDAAQMRGVAEKTIDRQLDFIRKWLEQNMSNGCPPPLTKAASSNRT